MLSAATPLDDDNEDEPAPAPAPEEKDEDASWDAGGGVETPEDCIRTNWKLVDDAERTCPLAPDGEEEDKEVGVPPTEREEEERG